MCFEWQVVCALPWKNINLRFKCLHSRINCTQNLREIWRSYLTVLAVRNFCFPPAQKPSYAINIVEHSNQLRDWHWQDLFSFFFFSRLFRAMLTSTALYTVFEINPVWYATASLVLRTIFGEFTMAICCETRSAGSPGDAQCIVDDVGCCICQRCCRSKTWVFV